MRRVLTFVVLLAVVSPVMAQEEELRDHPAFPRYPGFIYSDGSNLEFGTYEISLQDGTINAEGRYTRRDYALPEGAKNPGPVALGRNYRNAMLAKGGKILYDQLDNSGGVLSATLTIGGAKVWVEVVIYSGGASYSLHIIEEDPMAQRIELDASQLAKALQDTGRVAVHGILFETGKATITPASAAALAPIVEVLQADAALKIEIEGHTDNVGAAAANLKLSQDRAAAVKRYLVTTGGIDAARLTTAGFGDTRPVADNGTEEGRARNRRVELVRK